MYIRMRLPRMTIPTYLKLLQESEANLVTLLNNQDVRDPRRDYSAQSWVTATWHVSFEQIRKTDPDAADLLALMSMFDRQGIPENLLQGNMSQLQFEETVAPLLHYSLIKEERGQKSFEMHHLVQILTRKWLELNNQLDRWTKRSTAVMEAIFPSGAYGTWMTCRALLPHAKA